jgi:hypothetical protein
MILKINYKNKTQSENIYSLGKLFVISVGGEIGAEATYRRRLVNIN